MAFLAALLIALGGGPSVSTSHGIPTIGWQLAPGEYVSNVEIAPRPELPFRPPGAPSWQVDAPPARRAVRGRGPRRLPGCRSRLRRSGRGCAVGERVLRRLFEAGRRRPRARRAGGARRVLRAALD